MQTLKKAQIQYNQIVINKKSNTMDTNYPDQITIDVEARLHLQHVDIQESDHYIQEVSGTVISYPNAGSYTIVLVCDNNVVDSKILIRQ